MQRGDTSKEFGKRAPAESFDKFVDAFTGSLSSATGMPVEVLLMKFSENFSASRGALLLFWNVVLCVCPVLPISDSWDNPRARPIDIAPTVG